MSFFIHYCTEDSEFSCFEAITSLHSICLLFTHMLLFPNTNPSGSVKRPMGGEKEMKVTNIFSPLKLANPTIQTYWELLDKVREGEEMGRRK